MMERHIQNTLLLFIFLFFAPIACEGSHSHLFFTTTTTKDTSYDFPFYFVTRSIDDITLYWYDSNSEVVERRVSWFGKTNYTLRDASIEEEQTQDLELVIFEAFRKHVNDTEGFHVLQMLEGCILYDNQTFEAFFSYRYDGNPLYSLDMEKVKWVAEDPRAQFLADVENKNATLTENIRNNIVHSCLPHITELLSMGDCTFSRKEQPVVIVTKKPTINSTCILYCQAYGHYPKNISMTWYRNGQAVPVSLMKKVTLPFPDITYLTLLSVTITLNNNDIYTCDVDHSSLTLPLKVDFRESAEVRNGLFNGEIIAICLAAVLLLVTIVFGSVFLAKIRRQ